MVICESAVCEGEVIGTKLVDSLLIEANERQFKHPSLAQRPRSVGRASLLGRCDR